MDLLINLEITIQIKITFFLNTIYLMNHICVHTITEQEETMFFVYVTKIIIYILVSCFRVKVRTR